MNFWKAIEFVLCVLLAVVLMQSATAHIGNPYYFLSSIYHYQLVGANLGKGIAMVLPVLQFILAVCFLARIFVDGALLTSACMLTVFVMVQASALFRGLKIDCGCFGAGASSPIGEGSLFMVLTLTMIAWVAFLIRVTKLTPLASIPTNVSVDN